MTLEIKKELYQEDLFGQLIDKLTAHQEDHTKVNLPMLLESMVIDQETFYHMHHSLNPTRRMNYLLVPPKSPLISQATTVLSHQLRLIFKLINKP